MKQEYIDMARRLLKLPGVYLAFDAQHDEYSDEPSDWDRGTKFEPVDLDDPQAQSFTHYLNNPDTLSEADEFDLSYYNAEAWGEETSTLGEQIRLVRERFPDQDVDITTEAP